MRSIVVRLAYKHLWAVLIFILLLSGCGFRQKKSTAPEKAIAPSKSQTAIEAPLQSKVEEAIKQAEVHYQAGLEHYRNQRWDLASKEFDLSLKALLDADIDAEAHYKLGRIYTEFSEKINKVREQEPNSKLAQAPSSERSKSPASTPSTGTSSPGLPQQTTINQNQENQSQEFPLIFNAPVEIDEKIQEWIYLYTRKKDSNFVKGLERSAKYLPMIKKIFSTYDLPLDLIYIPLIESHFSTEAISPSGAVGMWQFVRSTARNYGLRVDKWVDERKDPVKSTHAAAKYLKDLYRMLGSWDLVVAAYNSGEYKIHNAIGRYRTRDFDELSSTGYLSTETQNYVPMLKAAIIVASNPNKYGLYPVYEAPLVYNDPTTPGKKPPVKTLAAKNPGSSQSSKELGSRTSSQQGSYPVSGSTNPRLKSSSNKEHLARIQFPNEEGLSSPDSRSSSKNQTFTAVSQPKVDEFGYEKPGLFSGGKRELVTYQIRRGDNLNKIASRFSVSPVQLIMWNSLSTAALTVDGELKIWVEKPDSAPVAQALPSQKRVQTTKSDKPVTQALPDQKKAWIKESNKPSKVYRLNKKITSKKVTSKKTTAAQAQSPKRKKIVYSVKKGDNLWRLSQNFNVDLNLLRKWNGLSPKEPLMPGDKLIIHLNQPIN